MPSAAALVAAAAALGSGTPLPSMGQRQLARPVTAELADSALADDDTCKAAGSDSGNGPCSLNALQTSASDKPGSFHLAATTRVEAVPAWVGRTQARKLASSPGHVMRAVSVLSRTFSLLSKLGKDAPDHECHIRGSEQCLLSSMTRRLPVAVSPGGLTACIDPKRSYQFEVIPGDVDKLLVYLQGGGACWDEWSTVAKLSVYDNPGFCMHHPLYNALDAEFINTRFKDYTIVHILYCSGDLFVGNVTRSYKLQDGVDLRQRGYHNAKAAIDWAKANLAPHLSSLVLMGASAGAIGLLFWSHSVLKAFQYKRASVVLDSYVGFFPEGTLHPVLRSYGSCDLGLLPDSLASECSSSHGDVTSEDIYKGVMSEFPAVAFAHINSKQDKVQMIFYDLLSYSFGMYSWFNFVGYSFLFARYVTQLATTYQMYPNYALFLVEGSLHCITYFPMTQALNKDFKVRGPLKVCSGLGKTSAVDLGDCLLELIDGPLQAGASSG